MIWLYLIKRDRLGGECTQMPLRSSATGIAATVKNIDREKKPIAFIFTGGRWAASFALLQN